MSLAPLLLVAACSRESAVFPKAPVILISIDTVRADHLPAYGYRGVETPNLESLRKDSVVFDNALAHVPLTLPSHASLFTGLFPFQNGVRDNLGYRLARTHTTLATFLRGRGYATVGAVSSIVLDRGSGIAEGFDAYEDNVEITNVGEAVGQVQRDGWQTERLLEEGIEKAPAGKSLFAFLHLYEPHTPYDPPEPFRSRYASSPYDGEIAAADAIVGGFVNYLKGKGIYDRSLIVLLSDHGEGLGDHGEEEHGIFLYREAIQVPLFIKLPGSAQAGRRVADPAGIADVFPTVLSALGEKPAQDLPGIPLLTRAERKSGSRRVYSETLYPRFHFGWSDLASLTDGRYQYIDAPRPELYDWRADPGEKHDLSGGLPPAFRSMRVELDGMNRPMQAPGREDPETVRKLASLGYIGAASPNLEEDLPDPKDRIRTLDRLKEAARLASQHRDEEAISALRRLAKENPLMLDVWETLARTLRRAGRPKEALDALLQADRLSPATPQILLGLADLCLETRDFQRARFLAEAAGAVGASNFREELAAIALAEGDLKTARSLAQGVLSTRSTARAPWLLLAKIETESGDLKKALDHLERALAIERRWHQPPLWNLQSTRGHVLAQMGEEKEAEEAFRAEIRSFPENLEAWSRLALLYASAGRVGEFRRLVAEMTVRVPTASSFEAAARVSDIVGDRKGALEWRKRKNEKFAKTG